MKSADVVRSRPDGGDALSGLAPAAKQHKTRSAALRIPGVMQWFAKRWALVAAKGGPWIARVGLQVRCQGPRLTNSVSAASVTRSSYGRSASRNLWFSSSLTAFFVGASLSGQRTSRLGPKRGPIGYKARLMLRT